MPQIGWIPKTWKLQARIGEEEDRIRRLQYGAGEFEWEDIDVEEPPEPPREPWQQQLWRTGLKGLEYALTPFTMYGAAHKETIRQMLEGFRQPWAGITTPPSEIEWPSPVERMKEIAPGGRLYEEAMQAGWEQLPYELPMWGTIPSALGLRRALAPAAARPGLAAVPAEAARVALAPIAGVEKAIGVGLKYGIGFPLKYGVAKPIELGVRKSFEKALDLGLDKWLVRQGIRGDQASNVVRFFLEKHNRWLYLRAQENWLKRIAEKKGTKYATQRATSDTIKEAEPLLLQAAKDVGIEVKPTIPRVAPKGLITQAEMPKGMRDHIRYELTQMAETQGKAEMSAEGWYGLLDKETSSIWTVNPRLGIKVKAFENVKELPDNWWEVVAKHPNRTSWQWQLIEKAPAEVKTSQKKWFDWIYKDDPRLKARTVSAFVEMPKPIEGAITEAQRTQIFDLGKGKAIITERGELKPQLRRLLIGMTGQYGTTKTTKALMSGLTGAEANSMIDALGRLEVKFGKPPKIPPTVGLITKEFADKIPLLNEIGILEKVRPTRQVFEKMGLRAEVWEPAFKAEIKIYEDLMAFRKELAGVERLVGKVPERRRAVFRALEKPEDIKYLSADERKAHLWFKKHFDEWADKLNLPAEKRRTNYVTHIFEEEIAQALAAKHPIDPSIIRAIDYITPKTVFNPYLEKRLGQRLGLKQDPFSAAEAYEGRALKVYHYEPLIQRIRVYEKYLPPHSAAYLRNFITRITGRPLMIDRELAQTLKEFSGTIKGLPGGKQLSELLTRGNFGGLLAYQYASFLYFSWLGFKPTSAIRNLSQHSLALAEVGPIRFAEGIALRVTAEGKSALKECLILRSRPQALLPGVDASFASRWTDTVREKALWMFRKADRQNVSDAFLSGYAEMKALAPDAGREWWIRRGNEVAGDTQYIYTTLGGASWSQSAIGRALSPLTTWPENWLELMSRFVKGRPSYVFREYEAATGKKVGKEMSWLLKRKAILLYLAIVGTAYAVEAKTPIQASQYTGWTSIRYLIQMARGELPALDLPGAVAQIVGGALTGNPTLIKQGWSRLRPDRLMGIIRQIQKVVEGKADWLSLFIYLNPEKEERGKYKPPKGPTAPGAPGQYKWEDID